MGTAVKILPVELNNNDPEAIVQKSVTSVTANYLFATASAPQKTANESEIPQGEIRIKDSFKELLYSQHANIRESADIEEPNVPSAEDKEPTELVNAEFEFILERSTTESRDVPTVAASLIDHELFTTKKSTLLSSTMPPPPP
ncbi:hypothetical protein K3495_g983 [Podosphaera aphanis]|nr:hypothetical protein K3495_g983 [Podosphaera aphanis]